MGKALAVVVSSVLVASVAACGDSGGGGSTASSGGSGASVNGAGKKLTVWIMEGTNPDATSFFDEVKTAFKAQTGADLDIQMVPWAGAMDKFNTSIAGGTTPDVAEVGTTWVPNFASLGVLENLKPSVDAAGLGNDLVSSLVDAATFSDGLYGMPWYAGVRAFIYNKDIFTKAGITTPPKSWDELLAAVAKIKKTQPTVIALPVAGGSSYSYDSFVWGAGGDLATQNGDKWSAAVNQAKAVEGLQFWTDLALKHGSSTAAASTWKETDSLAAFEKGTVGMTVSGSWTIAKIKQDAPAMAAKTGAFVMPGKDGKIAGSFVGGSVLSVFAKSQNKDLAWAFVKLMTTGDYAAKWGTSSNYFPGQKSLLDKQLASADATSKVFVQQMVDGGKSVPVTPAWGDIEAKKTITTMVQSVLTGKASAQQAAEAAAKDMDASFNA